MGAIKEFFFDEINAMQDGEDLHIDDEYMYIKWREAQEIIDAEQEIKDFEQRHENDLVDEEFIEETFKNIQRDCDDAQLPLWMHSQL